MVIVGWRLLGKYLHIILFLSYSLTAFVFWWTPGWFLLPALHLSLNWRSSIHAYLVKFIFSFSENCKAPNRATYDYVDRRKMILFTPLYVWPRGPAEADFSTSTHPRSFVCGGKKNNNTYFFVVFCFAFSLMFANARLRETDRRHDQWPPMWCMYRNGRWWKSLTFGALYHFLLILDLMFR